VQDTQTPLADKAHIATSNEDLERCYSSGCQPLFQLLHSYSYIKLSGWGKVKHLWDQSDTKEKSSVEVLMQLKMDCTRLPENKEPVKLACNFELRSKCA
jgi:hypothetical protein